MLLPCGAFVSSSSWCILATKLACSAMAPQSLNATLASKIQPIPTGLAIRHATRPVSIVSDILPTMALMSASTATCDAPPALKCSTTARPAPLLAFGRPSSAPQPMHYTPPALTPVLTDTLAIKRQGRAISATRAVRPASTQPPTAPAASAATTGLDGFATVLAPLSTSSIPMAPTAPNARLSAMSALEPTTSALSALFPANFRPTSTTPLILVVTVCVSVPLGPTQKHTITHLIYALPVTPTALSALVFLHPARSAFLGFTCGQIIARIRVLTG
jgi:hypothetical protein